MGTRIGSAFAFGCRVGHPSCMLSLRLGIAHRCEVEAARVPNGLARWKVGALSVAAAVSSRAR